MLEGDDVGWPSSGYVTGRTGMATFVLVPGAWLGRWCWRRVTPLLEDEGHAVLTPTLTGLGERTHLASPAVDLDMHIQDVVNVLVWEDVREAVLVGHSYAAFVVAGIADRAPDRIAKLVFLDTVIPVDGQAFLDLWSPEGRAVVEVAATKNGGGWPMPDDLGEDAADLTDEDARWLRSKASPQPLGTLTQPLRLSNASTASVPQAYICCRPSREQFAGFLRPFRDDPAWQFLDLDSGHWPMVSGPEALAEALLEVAG